LLTPESRRSPTCTIDVHLAPPGLSVRGEVDTATAHDLDDAYESLRPDPDGLTVDLSGVTFFSAAGVTRLVRWGSQTGGPLRIVVSPQVERLLAICGVTTDTLSRVRPVDIVNRSAHAVAN